MVHVRLTATVIAAVFALVLPVCGQSAAEKSFDAHCVNCHGSDGAGKTAYANKVQVPDLRAEAVQRLTDDELYDSIGRGTRHKEYPHAFEFRGMSTAEIRSLVTYIRSLARK